MDFVLKQFDDVMLNFMAKRTIDGIDVSITSINKDKVERLPLGMSPTSESLTRWLRHRTIPANRAYAQNFLSKNGLSENDFIGILQICKGLSLTDCYWVTYPNDQKTFAEVNLFDNRFSQVLSQIAFTGYGSSPASKFRSSPEFTTNGMLPKAWRRKEGKVLLYKGGTSGLANTGKEPYSEFYAAQVADAMGIPHVTYGLSKWKGQLCSTCELFTSKDISFVPASTLISTSRISQIIDWFDDHGWKNDLADMLVLDAVIRNTDRHLGNFGFLVDNHTNQLLRPGSLLVDIWCGGNCGLNQHLFKVTSNNYDKWFYYLWTAHHLDRFIAVAADKATTMGHIKREELEKVEVIIPSKCDYKRIGALIKPLFDLIISNRIENRKLTALRNTLLPKIMAGEIDVSDIQL